MSIEIINTRTIATARERVFGAFADPRVLATWWGPTGFSNTVPEFDFRPGGTWRILMRAPDGTTFDNRSTFLEIVTPEKIVYEHLQPMHRFTMTMLYRAPNPGVTELEWRMVLNRSPEHERLKDFLFQANEQNFDRLCAVLHAGSKQT